MGKPLFSDEIEAWQNGPVVRRVWVAGRTGELNDTFPPLTDEERTIVDAVYECYGAHGGRALSIRTHLEQPWIEARADLPASAPSQASLALATMRRHFTEAAVLQEEPIPTPPVQAVKADDQSVAAEAKNQSTRWRKVLDILATQ